MVYTPPSVNVTSVANNRIINIDENARIPCIVGADNATKILKDGDYVEVDANKGIVKRIK